MKALVVCKEKEMMEQAKKIFEESGIEGIYSWKNAVSRKEYEGIDLVVSIGGDGTALSASHLSLDKPLLAVNSSPETSIGALTTLTTEELANKLKEIKENNFKTENLERIEVSINGKLVEHLALNDVFIASEKAYNISKYKLKFGGNEELQRSSGLIFSTGTGSTAWFRSAGGKSFSPQEQFIKMTVREPYCGKNECKLGMKDIEIKKGESIEIIPLMKSVVAVDSIREYLVNEGDRIIITISKNPLKRIV